MKEKRMKTSVSTGKVSLPSAQAAGWNVKVRAEHGYGFEKPSLVVEKWLVKQRDESIIAKPTGKTAIGTMNLKSNGKSRVRMEEAKRIKEAKMDMAGSPSLTRQKIVAEKA